jgi:hypothetical protein
LHSNDRKKLLSVTAKTEFDFKGGVQLVVVFDFLPWGTKHFFELQTKISNEIHMGGVQLSVVFPGRNPILSSSTSWKAILIATNTLYLIVISRKSTRERHIECLLANDQQKFEILAC